MTSGRKGVIIKRIAEIGTFKSVETSLHIGGHLIHSNGSNLPLRILRAEARIGGNWKRVAYICVYYFQKQLPIRLTYKIRNVKKLLSCM